jgi:hypothetical protein
MFRSLDATGTMSPRLPDDPRAAFIDRYDTLLGTQHGRVTKEYVLVPADLLRRTEELSPWLVRSNEWIGTLRPEPTKSG